MHLVAAPTCGQVRVGKGIAPASTPLLQRPARANPTAGTRDLTCCARGKDQDPDHRGLDNSPRGPASKKGTSFEKKDRRRGRPAHLRSPDDSPLRDANRDFVMGLLTARASRTLVVYLQETNMCVAQWLVNFMHDHPITLSGSWEDICGDTFLRKLLSMPVEKAKFSNGVDPMHDNFDNSIAVDPRSIAQRIMDIRATLAEEVVADLVYVKEDNNELLRQSLMASLEAAMNGVAADKDSSAESSSGGASDDDAGGVVAAAVADEQEKKASEGEGEAEDAKVEAPPAMPAVEAKAAKAASPKQPSDECSGFMDTCERDESTEDELSEEPAAEGDGPQAALPTEEPAKRKDNV